MIGKCKSSGVNLSFYLLDDKRKSEEVSMVRKHHLFSSSPQGLNSEMSLQASTSTGKKKVNKYIQHFIFSHHKSDNEIGLKKEALFLDQIERDLKKRGLDLKNTQYYIVRHQDKSHLHYHIAFNKVDNQGNSMKMHNASYKAKNVAIQLSREHGLECGIKNDKEKNKALEKQPSNEIIHSKKLKNDLTLKPRGKESNSGLSL